MTSTFLRHDQCPDCGSSDNVVVYWNEELGGETWSCMTPGCSNFKSDGTLAEEQSAVKIDGLPLPDSWLHKLRISREVATRYGVLSRGKIVFFPYKSTRGVTLKAKCRDYSRPKDSRHPDPPHFYWIGEADKSLLYGTQACASKKNLIITQGEWDAIAAAEIMGKWYSAVSVDNGDRNTIKCLKKQLQWIDQFEKVYLAFDNDVSGQAVVAEAAKLIGTKCHIVQLPQYTTKDGVSKDAKDYRQHGLDEEFKQAIFAAQAYTPDFIYSDDQLFSEVRSFLYDDKRIKGYSTGIETLDLKVGGLRVGEVSVVMGLPGRGKSTLARNILSNLIRQGVVCQYISLEEMGAVGATRVMEDLTGVRLIRHGDGSANIPPDELQRLYNESIKGRLVMGRVAGYLPSERLQDLIYYGAKGRDVKFVLFDHITAATDGEVEQNKAISRMMQQCNALAQELQIHIMVISHTKRKESDAEALEEGEDPTPTIRDGFGSSGVEQYTHLFLALQAQLTHTKLHILKNRLWGDKGTVVLYYSNGTYRDINNHGTTRKEVQGTGRNQVRQQIRADNPEPSPATQSEHNEVCSVHTTADAEERCSISGGTQPEGNTVQGGDMDAGLDSTQRDSDRNQGTDAGGLSAEGRTVPGTASFTGTQITLGLSKRKPLPTKQQGNVQTVGDKSGDTPDRMERVPTQAVASLTALFSKHAKIEGDDDDATESDE